MRTHLVLPALLAILPACTGTPPAPDGTPPEGQATTETPTPEGQAETPDGVHGTVTLDDGKPVAGLMVTAKTGTVETTVFTDAEGGFHLAGLGDGTYDIRAHHPGYQAAMAQAMVKDGAAEALALKVSPGSAAETAAPTSAWLALLPDDAMRREFILNCGTCHGLTKERIMPSGKARTAEEWEAAIAAMRAMDAYDVIPPDFDDKKYAAWLAEHLSDEAIAAMKAPPLPDPAKVAGVTITEWTLPHPQELPHDLVLGPDGRVWVTGFWRGEMWAMDPSSGEIETFDVYENRNDEVPAQTRALKFDADGMLWMINGGTSSVVKLDPKTKAISTFDVGMYAHDIDIDSKGHIWFNDYFAEKERIGTLDPSTGEVRIIDLPSGNLPKEAGKPLPYGMNIDGDDRLFSSQLAGNTLVRYDINTGESKLYPMPDENVGPRRMAVGPDGTLWIPEYNTGRITAFDPKTETFETIDLGWGTAGIYDSEANSKTGELWLTGSLDTSLWHVDPETKTPTRIPLPTEPALSRHMAVDPETGDVWVAYSSLPSAQVKVARLSRTGS
jgi:virginiamycin B lyase